MVVGRSVFTTLQCQVLLLLTPRFRIYSMHQKVMQLRNSSLPFTIFSAMSSPTWRERAGRVVKGRVVKGRRVKGRMVKGSPFPLTPSGVGLRKASGVT